MVVNLNTLSHAFLLSLLISSLGGCLSDTTKGPASNLQAAADQLQSTLDNSSKDATKLRRLNFAYRLTREGTTVAPQVVFAAFACQGAGAYGQQRAALGAVRQLSTTVDTLSGPANSDIGKVMASIGKYRSKVDSLPDVKDNVEGQAFADCKQQTAIDLGILFPKISSVVGPEGKFLPAVAGAISAMQALATAVEKLVLLAAQQVDVAQRAARFRDFMSDSQTRKTLQDILGACVIPIPTPGVAGGTGLDISKVPPKDMADFTKKCFADYPAAVGAVALSDANMKAIIDERRRLSLLVPYFNFAALPKAGGSEAQSKYLAAVDKVDQSLATFDTLRETKIAKDQQLKMATAVNDLWRISQGRLTSEEELSELWGAAQQLVALFQNASEDLGGVEDKGKALIDAIKKL